MPDFGELPFAHLKLSSKRSPRKESLRDSNVSQLLIKGVKFKAIRILLNAFKTFEVSPKVLKNINNFMLTTALPCH